MHKLYKFLLLLVSVAAASCGKDFLDEKPNKALLVPVTLTDFQSLLDNTSVMNKVAALPLIATDDFYTTDNGWQAYTSAAQRNSYIWASDIYEGGTDGGSNDWDPGYKIVFYCNIVLDGLKGLDATLAESAEAKRIKGSALFYRGFAYCSLAQAFTAPYDKQTAASMPGIPLRTVADVNVKVGRGTVEQTYRQVLSDLELAYDLLPPETSSRTRPSKPAAAALLARVNLIMEDYAGAEIWATSSLKLNSKLTDINTTAIVSNVGTDEVLFNAASLGYNFVNSALTLVNTELYQSFTANDLRKTGYFLDRGNNTFGMKGIYAGNIGRFAGLANDEVYLIRAECYARQDKPTEAMADLNTLLVKRWKQGAFVAFTAANAEDALKKILVERRKELVSRGTRWMDLRRLNKDPRFAVTLARTVKGQTYTLLPNDKRYVYPVPDNEVRLSGIEQNPR